MEYLLIDTSSATPVYIQILDQIRVRVRDGSLPPGRPLPSVRQLAADLAINPNTVAKAYMLLERDGIVRTVRRRGTFVAQGAEEKAREAADQRLDHVVDRLIQEAESLGVDRKRFLETMRRKLNREESRDRPLGGDSQ